MHLADAFIRSELQEWGTSAGICGYSGNQTQNSVHANLYSSYTMESPSPPLLSCPIVFRPVPSYSPQPQPISIRHAFVVPFPSANVGDQRVAVVYCSSVMVWKQPSSEAFDFCRHINQSRHTICLHGPL